jgi:hypothetical protein
MRRLGPPGFGAVEVVKIQEHGGVKVQYKDPDVSPGTRPRQVPRTGERRFDRRPLR